MRQLTPYRRESLWDFMSELDKAFEGFWPERTAAATARTEFFSPPVDLREEKDHFLVSLDLPGLKPEEVKIDVQQGRLTVTGERKREETKADGMFKRVEKTYGRFERSFQLPQNVSEDKISAHFEHGVLEVVVPKAEISKGRSIQIESKKH
ncbi:MAG: Hsp20/alpha crystallin family protein [Bdellovibrionales bacterium]